LLAVAGTAIVTGTENVLVVGWTGTVCGTCTLNGTPPQVTGLAPAHTPAWQMSVSVHALLSLQIVPSRWLAKEQVPSPLHVPAWWHWSGAAQVKEVPAQVPLVQMSFCVHALLSLQLVPSDFAGFEHTPFAGSQTPGTWHWSSAVQTTGFAPEQDPFWHVSVCVHALPSLHALPLDFAGFEQTPFAGSQTPGTWH
jgi:hypothetical protein